MQIVLAPLINSTDGVKRVSDTPTILLPPSQRERRVVSPCQFVFRAGVSLGRYIPLYTHRMLRFLTIPFTVQETGNASLAALMVGST